ncbi:hypothetical protein [Nonomuraea helvata]|uniref:Uncharacterized protein n=1 Tax=Nonomuraea helvata TaxID=37484 RepID=A0ABV5SF57_9ACTN
MPDADGIRAALQAMAGRGLLVKNASCRYGLPSGGKEGLAMT